MVEDEWHTDCLVRTMIVRNGLLSRIGVKSLLVAFGIVFSTWRLWLISREKKRSYFGGKEPTEKSDARICHNKRIPTFDGAGFVRLMGNRWRCFYFILYTIDVKPLHSVNWVSRRSHWTTTAPSCGEEHQASLIWALSWAEQGKFCETKQQLLEQLLSWEWFTSRGTVASAESHVRRCSSSCGLFQMLHSDDDDYRWCIYGNKCRKSSDAAG